MVAPDDDDSQEVGPSGIGRHQSALSGASVVAAASNDEGGVIISVQFHAYVAVCFPDMHSSIGVLCMST